MTLTTTETTPEIAIDAIDQLDLRGWTVKTSTLQTLRLTRETPVQGNETLTINVHTTIDDETEYYYQAEEGGHHIDSAASHTLDELLDQVQIYIHDHPQQ